MKIVLREPVLSCYYDFTDPDVRSTFMKSLNLPEEFGVEITSDEYGSIFYVTKMLSDMNGNGIKGTYRSMDIEAISDRGDRMWIKESQLMKIKSWVSGLRLPNERT